MSACIASGNEAARGQQNTVFTFSRLLLAQARAQALLRVVIVYDGMIVCTGLQE